MALGVWGAERRALYYPGGAFSLDRLSWTFAIENQERPLAFARTPLRARRPLAPAYARLPCSTPTWWPSGTRSATTATRCGMTSLAIRTGGNPLHGQQGIYHDPAHPSAVLLPVVPRG
jgi:hypothetical protein